MRRKIIKQGHNTLTISLPRKWCDRHGLKGGEDIDVTEKGSNLVMSKATFKGTGEVAVDVSGLDRSTIIILIESLYNYGYDLIRVTTKDARARYHMTGEDVNLPTIVYFAMNRMMGAEIIRSTPTEYVIEILTEDTRKKFDVVIRRTFLLILELLDSFIEGVRKDDESFVQVIEFKHMHIKRLVNYSMRTLNKFGHEEADKTTFYFAILNFLNKTDDVVKNFAYHSLHKAKLEGATKRLQCRNGHKETLDLSKKCCDMIEEIRDAFRMYYEVFYKYDAAKVSELMRARDLFKNKLYVDEYCKLKKDDVFLLGGFVQIFDIIVDLCELRMSMGYTEDSPRHRKS